MRLAVGLLTLLLAGCGKTIIKTEIVEIPVTKFVPIPAELLLPCPIAEGEVSAVFDVARARKQSLVDCNAQLDSIRDLQPEDKP